MDTGHGKSLASMYLNLNLNLGQQDMFRYLGKRYRNAMAPLIDSVVERMRGTAFPTIDTTRLFAGALTPNLRELGTELPIMRAIELGRDEGIGLYGVPRAAVARRFLTARDMPARRRVLGDASTLFLDDCHDARYGATAAGLEFTVVMLRDAISTARTGHVIAAQAAATAALDGATRSVLDDKKVREAVTRTGNESQRDRTVLDAFTIREALALMPVYGVHVNYRHWEEPVPWAFSRHATTHSAARRHSAGGTRSKRSSSPPAWSCGSTTLPRADSDRAH